MGMTPGKFKSMKDGLKKRAARESAIPVEEIIAAIEQIIEHPTLGAGKGALKLIEDNKSILSAAFYNDLKNLITEKAQAEYLKRKEESKVLANHRDRQNKANDFEKVTVSQIHEVWSTDFTEIEILGIKFMICVIYELYSHAYLAIEVAQIADTGLAQRTLHEAIKYAGCRPQRCLLSDNGSQFIGEGFTKTLNDLGIDHKRTPPGQPWYNGALESGNKDLKKVIYTQVAFTVAEDPRLGRRGQREEIIQDLLTKSCYKVQTIINDEIPRPMHKATPRTVLQGGEEQCRHEQERAKFIKVKKEERREIMAEIRKSKVKSKPKTFIQKATRALTKTLKELNTEKVYTLWSLLRGNFSIVTE